MSTARSLPEAHALSSGVECQLCIRWPVKEVARDQYSQVTNGHWDLWIALTGDPGPQWLSGTIYRGGTMICNAARQYGKR